jgi:glycyl-tRNA synthetase
MQETAKPIQETTRTTQKAAIGNELPVFTECKQPQGACSSKNNEEKTSKQHCKKCKKPNKIDKSDIGKVKCDCSGDYEVLGDFNLMFKTNVGPVPSENSGAYLRPETAQLIFADFKLVQENARMKLPFGIAQVGKAFRNEISPREFLFRCREFEQMEIEYFIEKGMKCPYMDEINKVELELYSEEMQKKGKLEGERMKLVDAFKKGVIKTDWHAFWIANELQWFILLGANPEKFRARQHTSEEKSHYASDTWDLEYNFPMGWRELQGFANRGNYDLSQHEKHIKKNLSINTDNGKVLPEVVCEPSLGVGRAFLVFMFDAYSYDKKREKFYYANLKTKQSSWTRPDLDPNFLNEDIIFNFNQNELKYVRELFDEVLL